MLLAHSDFFDVSYNEHLLNDRYVPSDAAYKTDDSTFFSHFKMYLGIRKEKTELVKERT